MGNLLMHYGTWHELKVWPKYFIEIINSMKKFEARKNDRDFKFGDYLRLREWDPETEEYTGAEVIRRVDFILHGGEFGIKKGYCVMSLSKV